MQLGKRLLHALCDTGASVSLVAQNVLPQSYVIDKDYGNSKLKGVTGTEIPVVGMCNMKLQIGNRVYSHRIYVVNKLQNNSLILGHDFISKYGCIIDYQDLIVSVDGTVVPMLKADKISRKPLLIACSKTTELKPHTSAFIPYYVSSKIKYSSRRKENVTLTGITDTINNCCSKLNLYTNESVVNVISGKGKVLVMNLSEKPITLYKNKKLSNLVTFDEKFVAHLNTTSENDQNFGPTKLRSRWNQNIGELFKQLGIDQNQHLTSEEKAELKALVQKFKDIFSENEDDMSTSSLMKHKIIMNTNVPIRDKFRTIPLAMQPIAEQEIEKLFKLGIIEETSSPYHASAFLVKKSSSNNSNNKWRVVSDFRLLNSHIVRTMQPLPDVDSLLSIWAGASYWTVLDFKMGYHQLELDDESKQYTASSIKGVSSFQYTKLPAGISSAPAFYQALVEKIFMGLNQFRGNSFFSMVPMNTQIFNIISFEISFVDMNI